VVQNEGERSILGLHGSFPLWLTFCSLIKANQEFFELLGVAIIANEGDLPVPLFSRLLVTPSLRPTLVRPLTPCKGSAHFVVCCNEPRLYQVTVLITPSPIAEEHVKDYVGFSSLELIGALVAANASPPC